MLADRLLTSTDFHTGGIGMRLVTSGLGPLPGATLAEQRRHFQQHLDCIRTGLCLPRGATPAAHRGDDAAALAPRRLRLAVHVPPGLLRVVWGGHHRRRHGRHGDPSDPADSAETLVLIDTEAGLLETVVHTDADRVAQVTRRLAPSYAALTDQSWRSRARAPSAGHRGRRRQRVRHRRGWIPLPRRPPRARGRIARRGMAVRDAVNAQLRVEVPGHGSDVDNVLVHELPGAQASRRTRSCGARARSTPRPAAPAPARAWRSCTHRGRMAVGTRS